MISSISLENFQSHKRSDLHFSPGVNVIIGSSDSGKTAILRALNWSLYNRPSGLSNISYWNRDKKGQPKKDTSVEILKEDTVIRRIRSNDFNGYEICVGHTDADITLEAIGTDVPEKITKHFNLTEINIQKQMDAPFLLSESSSEVARFFNRIVRLDLIDKVLSNAETIRRRTGREIEENNALIEKLKLDIEQYSWIDDVEGDIQKAERRSERVEQKRKDCEKIFEVIRNTKIQQSIIDKYQDVEKTEDLINKALELRKSVEEIMHDSGRLRYLLSKINENTDLINKSKEIIQHEKKVEEALALNESIEKRFDIIDKIEGILKEEETYKKEILIKEKDIEFLESKLPALCPLCGNPMKVNHNHG